MEDITNNLLKKFYENLNILITGMIVSLFNDQIFLRKKLDKKIISIDSREIEFLKITNRKVKYIKIDINNKFKIEQIIRKNEINVIFHTASNTGLRGIYKSFGL